MWYNADSMKKGFTLVELLVVVVVLVTLMSITFRIGSVGSETGARSTTVNRLQRLENCLSGYYAAYGSYPPVRLHGSRDYTLAVNAQGIQQVDSDDRSDTLEWDRVKAACRSQPVGMSFPYKDQSMRTYVAKISNLLQQRASSSRKADAAFAKYGPSKYAFEALTDASIVSGKSGESDWSHVQVYKFGLLSFLLPRYLVMMGGDNSSSRDSFYDFSVWTQNNQMPCDFESGVPYSSWAAVNSDAEQNPWKIAVLSSQAVCARWLVNLEGTLACNTAQSYYGIDLRDTKTSASTLSYDNPNPEVWSAADSQSGSGSNYSQQYVLDCITIKDGWNNDFYYYSPAPHQTYTLWSAGANGKTFPPWVPEEEIRNINGNSTIREWVADDIVQMSN